ncbi:MAG: ABC transporter [Puniceicoccaceae bacterium]|nr:MAG: ABC transporter [Puniceicoccaceae bacterium]
MAASSFQSNRWLRLLNVAIQVVLVLVVFGAVNYLGSRFFHRTDLTTDRIYSLSAETQSYIRQLEHPVTVVVTIIADDAGPELEQAFRDVRGILREYAYASRNNPEATIEVEFVNVFQQRRRAEALGLDQPNVVLFQSGNRQRTVFLNDLYRTRDRQRKEFQGERIFTSALLDVTSRQRPVLYFLTGHGEMRLNDVDPIRGLSQLEGALLTRNFDVRPLDLNLAREVPEDASMVILPSPQAPLFPWEQEALRRYLGPASGRLLILLDPAVSHHLDDLLFEWGILADDVLVIERDPANLLEGGDLLLRRFARHPVTELLIDNQIPIVSGRARSVRMDPGRPLDDSLQVTELIATSDRSWGERHYTRPGTPTFDPTVDLRGPVKVAAIAERKVDSRLGISIPAGRLIVFGTSDFISNNRINALGNLTLFLNTVNWALDRDELLNIPARPVRTLQLNLSQHQLALSRFGIWFGPPLLVAAFGFFIHLIRRH